MTTYQYCFYKKCEPWNWGGSRRWCRKCWPRIESRAIAISEIENVADRKKKRIYGKKLWTFLIWVQGKILKLIFLNGIWFVWDLGVLIGVVDVPEEKQSRFSLSGWQDILIGWQYISIRLTRYSQRFARYSHRLTIYLNKVEPEERWAEDAEREEEAEGEAEEEGGEDGEGDQHGVPEN